MQTDYNRKLKELVKQYEINDLETIYDIFNTPNYIGVNIASIRSWLAPKRASWRKKVRPEIFELFEFKARIWFDNK